MGFKPQDVWVNAVWLSASFLRKNMTNTVVNIQQPEFSCFLVFQFSFSNPLRQSVDWVLASGLSVSIRTKVNSHTVVHSSTAGHLFWLFLTLSINVRSGSWRFLPCCFMSLSEPLKSWDRDGDEEVIGGWSLCEAAADWRWLWLTLEAVEWSQLQSGGKTWKCFKHFFTYLKIITEKFWTLHLL